MAEERVQRGRSAILVADAISYRCVTEAKPVREQFSTSNSHAVKLSILLPRKTSAAWSRWQETAYQPNARARSMSCALMK